MAGDVTDTMEERLGRVETQVVGLRGDVQKLRVLEEANAQTIALIAEGHGATLDSHTATLDSHTATLHSHTATLDSHTATLDSHTATLNSHTAKLDAHDAKLDALGARLDAHGRKLDDITEALKPLGEIHDFVKRVAHEHEIRIVALESRAGGKQPEG